MKLHMQILIALGLGIKRNGHIFLGLIAGIILGVAMHAYNATHEPTAIYNAIYAILNFIGQAFIRLIQMVIIPLIFSAIVIGISSIGDNKQLSAFGIKMVFYYSILSIAAVVIATTLAIGLHPGDGVQSFISAESAAETQKIVSDAIAQQEGHLGQMFINLIPANPIEAFSKGETIPIIIFVVIFAIALAKVGEINRPVVSFFESIFAATMKVTDGIMYLAAPGIFALMATAISSFGMSVFSSISKYFLAIFIGFGLQLLVVYPIIMKVFSKVPVRLFFAAIAEAMMVGFGTASSSATLPLVIACCEKRGISHKVCSFVLPLGVTLNFDATAMFQVIAVLFLTQAYGISVDPLQIIQIAVLAIVASSTCAGIPGGGIITIALVLNGLGLTPTQMVEGFAFLFAVDRIVDMFRTMLNITSDAVVTAVIADNENELNYDMLTSEESYKDII